MRNYQYLAPIELERDIAEQIMGLKVLNAQTTNVCADGCWMVSVGTSPGDWMCPAGLGYCYVSEHYNPNEYESDEDEKKIEGIPVCWLEPVPRYARDIAEAFKVVAKVRADHPEWYFSIYTGEVSADKVKYGGLRARFGDATIIADSLKQLPKAICIAALKAVAQNAKETK